MKKIAFLSQKGGSGKTTLAVHIAVAAQEAGENVVLIDTDPQKSATVWGEARAQETPVVATAAVTELNQVLQLAEAEAMSVAVIDTAPHAAPDAATIASMADLVVIPCRPAAFDIAAAASAVDIVRAAGVPAVFVLSACPYRAPETKETRVALGDYGLPVAPVAIIDRRSYSRAITCGSGASEYERKGKAAEEINKLWKWLVKGKFK